MRNFLFKLLTIILCFVLCVNFVRFLLSTSDGSVVVSATTFLDAFSNIGADAEPLFTDLNNILSYLLDLSGSFSRLFKIDYSAAWYEVILRLLSNFFDEIVNSVNLTISVISQLFLSLVDVIAFLYHFLQSIIRFLNAVLGTNYSTRKVSISGPPVGGGFSGRR